MRYFITHLSLNLLVKKNKIGEHLAKLQAKWLTVSYTQFALHFCPQRCRSRQLNNLCITDINCYWAKQALNDKLQGSVAAYLSCGGVVNNQIKKYLLLSVWVIFLKNRWRFGKVTSKNVIVSCTFFRLLAVCLPGAQSAWDNHALACNFAKCSPIKKNFYSHSAINFS